MTYDDQLTRAIDDLCRAAEAFRIATLGPRQRIEESDRLAPDVAHMQVMLDDVYRDYRPST